MSKVRQPFRACTLCNGTGSMNPEGMTGCGVPKIECPCVKHITTEQRDRLDMALREGGISMWGDPVPSNSIAPVSTLKSTRLMSAEERTRVGRAWDIVGIERPVPNIVS